MPSRTRPWSSIQQHARRRVVVCRGRRNHQAGILAESAPAAAWRTATPPGPEARSKWPPRAATRSRRLRRPMPRRGSLCMRATSKPLPSSRTARRVGRQEREGHADAARVRMARDIGQRLLRDAEQRGGLLVGQRARRAFQRHVDGQAALVSHLARQVAARGQQAEVVEQGGAQVARDPAHSLKAASSRTSVVSSTGTTTSACAGAWRRRLAAVSSSSLTDTSSWLTPSCRSRDRRARSSSCDCTTRWASWRSLASASRCSLMLRASAGRHQQDADGGDHADPGHGLADIGLGARIELAQRLFHVVEVDAGAQHPAPFGHRHHVAELGRELLGEDGFITGSARPAAGTGGGNQALDGGHACGSRSSHSILPPVPAGAGASGCGPACRTGRSSHRDRSRAWPGPPSRPGGRRHRRARRAPAVRSRFAPARRNGAARFPCSCR